MVPAFGGFWDLKKPTLHEICIRGIVEGPLLTPKPPTFAYIRKNCSSENRVSGGSLRGFDEDFALTLKHRFVDLFLVEFIRIFSTSSKAIS